MYNHSISGIKRAARRVLGQYLFRCCLASFLSGVCITLIFSYILDGTMQLENAFDPTAFYSSIASAKSFQDVYRYIRDAIASLVESIGYDAYSRMLRKFALAMAVSFILQFIYRILVVLPFQVGSCRFYMDSFYTEPKYRQLLSGFTANYLNVIKIQLFRQIRIFLWSLLLVVPGVIKAYETFMIPYLLAENPDISYKEAFASSRRMMEGNKLNVLVLNLSFIGWMFLSALTNGAAYILFVAPYYDAALANMALRIKAAHPRTA